MQRSLFRPAILPALVAASLALPAAAEEAHHAQAEAAKPPATQPQQPRAAQPGMQQPSGMTMGNMMQMMQMMQQMQQMMSGTQDRGAMHRRAMMGMGTMGMMGAMQEHMTGRTVANAEGQIAFVKAELKIAAAQEKVWDDYAAVLRANAKQLAELVAERAKVPATAAPADWLALREKTLVARLEIVRRTQPALTALYAALSEPQKKALQQLATPHMGMGMGM